MKYVTALVVLIFCGCATKYKEPVTNNVATIELNHIMPRGYTFLSKASSSDCEFLKDESMGSVGQMINASKQQLFKIEAGHNISLSVQTSITFNTQYNVTQKQQCLMHVNFTPELDHTYSIHQIDPPGGICEVFIIDKQTGIAPKDLNTENKTACFTMANSSSSEKQTLITNYLDYLEKQAENYLSIKDGILKTNANKDAEAQKIICDAATNSIASYTFFDLKIKLRTLDELKADMTAQQLERFSKTFPIIKKLNPENPFCSGASTQVSNSQWAIVE